MINLDLLTYDKYVAGNISLVTTGSWNWTILFGAFVSTLFLIIKTRSNSAANRKMLANFEGPKTYPIIGNLLLLFRATSTDVLPTISKLAENYGNRAIVWIFNKPFILLSNARDVEILLSSQTQTGDLVHAGLDWIFGDGLVTTQHENWKADRKLLSPAFKYQRFDGFLETFNKHGKVMVTNLEKEIPSENNPQDVYKAFALCTMDSLVESIFGVESNFQRDGDTGVYDNMENMLEAIQARIFKPWLQLPVICYLFGHRREENKTLKFARDLSNKVIKQRKNMMSSGELKNEKTKPLLDVLLTTRGDKNIFDHMMNIFNAGSETTARTLVYTLYLLASNPKHQKNVQNEIDTVFDEMIDGNLTFANLTELKYLERCIQESLRMFPSIPATLRKTTSDVKLDEAHVIPEGTEVIVDLYNLHHNPGMFADPEKFDPDRFLLEFSTHAKVGAYAPFSMGPRLCLGQRYAMIQLKVLLCNVLRSFDISTNFARKDLQLIIGAVLQPSPNIPLKLTRRTKNAEKYDKKAGIEIEGLEFEVFEEVQP